MHQCDVLGEDDAFRLEAETAHQGEILLDRRYCPEGTRAIDRDAAGGHAFQQEPSAGMQQLDRIRPALGAEAVGEVLGRQQAGRDPRARAQDIAELQKPAWRFDRRCDLGGARGDAVGCFQRAQFGIERPDLGRSLDVRQENDVRTPRHDAAQVVAAVVFQAVDADCADHAMGATYRHQRRNAQAGLRPVGRRGELLEVSHDHVGAAHRRRMLDRHVHARHEHPAAAQLRRAPGGIAIARLGGVVPMPFALILIFRSCNRSLHVPRQE